MPIVFLYERNSKPALVLQLENVPKYHVKDSINLSINTPRRIRLKQISQVSFTQGSKGVIRCLNYVLKVFRKVGLQLAYPTTLAYRIHLQNPQKAERFENISTTLIPRVQEYSCEPIQQHSWFIFKMFGTVLRFVGKDKS